MYTAIGAGSLIYNPGPLLSAATTITIDLTKARANYYEIHIHVKQAGSGSTYSLRPNGSTSNTDARSISSDRGATTPAVTGADVNPGWQLAGGLSANDEFDCWVQLYAEQGLRRAARFYTTIFDNAAGRTLRNQTYDGWFNDTTTSIDNVVINSDSAASGIGVGTIVRAWAIG